MNESIRVNKGGRIEGTIKITDIVGGSVGHTCGEVSFDHSELFDLALCDLPVG